MLRAPLDVPPAPEWTASPAVEQRARGMSKSQRVAYLKDHHWHRLGARDAQTWRAPDAPGLWTLAAAVRLALERER